jgi:hypothetical protein
MRIDPSENRMGDDPDQDEEGDRGLIEIRRRPRPGAVLLVDGDRDILFVRSDDFPLPGNKTDAFLTDVARFGISAYRLAGRPFRHMK